MICLTGDVHNSINSEEQKYYKKNEIELANRYLSIANQYDIKSTLFFTGKSVKENKSHFAQIINYNNLEIGGHT